MKTILSQKDRGTSKLDGCIWIRPWKWLCLSLIFLLPACSGPEDLQPERNNLLQAKVERVEGEGLILRAGARNPVHLHPGDPVYGGEVVTTEAGGTVELRMRDGSALVVRSGSRVKLNHPLLADVENQSAFLQRGRIWLRAQDSKAQSSPTIETVICIVKGKAVELELGISEDLGTLLAVKQGTVQMEGCGDKISVGGSQETEVEFLERPSNPKTFKEKTEADWAAWMAGRFRNLAWRAPELVTKVDRSLRETASRRFQVRSELDRRAFELETIVKAVGEANQVPALPGDASLVKLRQLALSQAESLTLLRHLADRTDTLLLEAVRLQKRLGGLRRELGDRYRPVEELLRLLLEGGKPLKWALEEERSHLTAQAQRCQTALAMTAGLAAPEEAKAPSAERPSPSQEAKDKPQAQASQRSKDSKKSMSGSSGSSSKGGLSKTQPRGSSGGSPGSQSSKTQVKGSAGSSKKSSSGISSSKGSSQGTSAKKSSQNKPGAKPNAASR